MYLQPSFFRIVCHLMLSALLVFTTTPGWAAPRDITPEEAVEIDNRSEETPRVGGRATLGGRVGEHLSEGYLDVLQPLAGGENSLLFFNPKLSGSDNDEEEYSLGLGLRVLLPAAGAIAGINAFYDARETQHGNTFDQLGLGLEVLTTWVDARANYYWPDNGQDPIERTSDTQVGVTAAHSASDVYAEGYQLLQRERTVTRTTTTTLFYDRFEAALEGYDAELGVKLPFLPDWLETRLFAGYYFFEGDFTKDIDGMKGRLEIRALPALTLDAEVYDNDDLTGSDYYFGARVNLPFDVANLSQGKNPFAGTRDTLRAQERRDLRDRLNEMVIRDPHVQIHESGYIEDVDSRTVKVKTEVDEDKVVVLDNVNFVNNQNVSGIENGSAEQPWNTVQEGVNNVFGERNIYVFKGMASYVENVLVAADDIKLYGEGQAIAGYGGKAFGGGGYPVLDGNVGGINGPVFRVTGRDVLIQGFEIARSAGGAAGGATDSFGEGLDLSAVGVVSENPERFTLRGNRIHDQEIGVMLLSKGAASTSASLLDNTLADSDIGVFSWMRGPGGTADLLLENNLGTGLGIGIQIMADTLASADITLRGNQIIQPANVGLVLQAQNVDNDLNLWLEGNTFSGSVGPGATLAAIGVGGDMNFTALNNAFSDNGAFGFQGLFADIDGNASLQWVGNQTDGNTGGGALMQLAAVGGNVDLDILDSSFDGNDGDGLILLATTVGGHIDARIDPTTANSNNSSGMIILFAATSNITVAAEQVTASYNQGNGLLLSAFSQTGSVQALLRDVVANSNLGVGVLASLGAFEEVILGSFDGSNAVGNRITANGNIGPGILLSAQSLTSELFQISETLVANDNLGPGVVMNLVGQGMVYNMIGRLDANGNLGGADLQQVSQSEVAYFELDQANLSSNASFGLNLVLNAPTGSALAVLGQEGLFLLPFSLGPSGPIVAEDNVGVGINVIASAGEDAVLIANELVARRNQGDGIALNLNAGHDVTAALGVGLQGGMELASSRVVVDNNASNGLTINATALQGTASLGIAGGTANSNTGAGVVANVTARQSSMLVLGAGFFELMGAEIPYGSFSADHNGGLGINALVSSTGSTAGFVFLNGGASGNGGDGLAVDLDALSQGLLILGAIMPGTADQPLRFNDNGGTGLLVNATSTRGAIQAVLGGVEANRNAGSGMHFTLSSSNELLFLAGISGLGGATVESRAVQANDNAGDGFSLTGSSSEGDISFFTTLLDASGNTGHGAAIDLSAADGDALVGLGVSSLYSPLLSGAMGATASSNTLDGLRLTVQASGRADLQTFNVTASGNAGLGLDAAVVGGEAVVSIDGLTASNNSNLGARVIAVGTTTNSTLTANNLALNSNGSTGGYFLARGGATATATATVTNSVANGNLGHGLVVAADGAATGTAIGQANASDNTRYGLVVAVVGSDSAIASALNPGVNNGEGATFVDSANTGNAADLVP